MLHKPVPDRGTTSLAEVEVVRLVAPDIGIAVDNHPTAGLLDQLQHLIQLIGRPWTQLGMAWIKEHVASKIRGDLAGLTMHRHLRRIGRGNGSAANREGVQMRAPRDQCTAAAFEILAPELS